MMTELKIRSTEIQIGHDRSSANAKQSNFPNHWKDRQMTIERQLRSIEVHIRSLNLQPGTSKSQIQWLGLNQNS